MPTTGPPRNRKRLILVTGAVVAVLLAAGLYWFQPWRLWTTTVVHDQLPILAAEAEPATPVAAGSASVGAGPATRRPVSSLPPAAKTPASSTHPVTAPITRPSAATTTDPTTASAPRTTPLPAGPVALSAGTLISHEHQTSGAVRVIRLADGSRVLTLEGLRTSDGPALHVWLSDAPVIDGEDGWHLFDDGRHVDLGALKGNAGDQVYPIPAGLDLTGLRSVSIWCQRFSVSFGAAELRSA